MHFQTNLPFTAYISDRINEDFPADVAPHTAIFIVGGIWCWPALRTLSVNIPGEYPRISSISLSRGEMED